MNEDRIAVLIGNNGQTKKLIEEKTGTILKINSKDRTVEILVNNKFNPSETQDEEEFSETFKHSLSSPDYRKYIASYIIEAINYGFNPVKALKLLDEEYMLEIIDLDQIVNHNPNKLRRLKGRIIGKNGKIRQAIEQFAGVYLSVYDKFIAIIAKEENMKIAKKAINMIIQGAPHRAVLNYLQEQYSLRKREEFSRSWKPVI